MIRTSPDRQGVRSRLPGGRAVVGGLLITVAAVGIFAAYTGSRDDDARSYLVAAHDIPEGRRLAPEDLSQRQGALSDELASRSFASPDELVGSDAIAPLRAGELIQTGDVVAGSERAAVPSREFSFAVEAEHAVDGTLRRGDVVDVLATYGTGSDAYTTVVSSHTKLIAVSSTGQQAMSSNTRIVLTVALPSPEQVVELAHATQTAAITLVRSTGTDTELSADPFTGRDKP